MSMIKAILVTVALIGFNNMASAEPMPPDLLVRHVTDEVLEIIKHDKDIQNGDMKKIGALAEEKIIPHFDFERMSRLALGKHWKDTSQAQRDAFITEFRSLVTRTFSSALSKYRNQSIEYKPLHSQSGDTEVKVKTLILQPGSEDIPVEYSLEKVGDDWKVFDVVIDDISLVTTHRGSFSTEIHQNGVDELTRKLAAKNK
jgi:phospholipid transport system substrate-binding protein